MITNYFKTTDIGLASYLKYQNIDLFSVDKNPDSIQCTFTFRIHEEDPYLLLQVTEWGTTQECNKLKRFMYMYNLMKKEIRGALTNSNGN